jgi:hypothetical protein
VDWLRRVTGRTNRSVVEVLERELASGSEDGGRPPEPSEAAAPFVRTAYVPESVEGSIAAGSGFGGQPHLADGVSHPSCPRCGESMPLVAQIDLAAQPAPVVAGTGLMQLFYCTRERDGMPCEVELGGWAAFSKAHVARLVPAGPGGAPGQADTPFEPQRVAEWTSVEDYPDWQELSALGADPGEPPDEVEPFPLDGEKLGGWPRWIQGIEYPSCPKCGIQMKLVLQVDSEKTLPTMWGDMGIGHVTQCPHHADVLTFAWACS